MDKALLGRNMLNGDNNSFFYNPEKWQPEGGPYTKKAIRRFIQNLSSSGIDTFLICPNCQLPCYPSKKLRFQYQDYRRGDREYTRGHWQYSAGCEGQALEDILDRQTLYNDIYLDLLEAGVDWLEECAVACREEGISPWLTVRMNDSHGGPHPEKSFMNNDLLKFHPESRLDKPCINPQKQFERYSLNYAKPECREYMLSVIADLLDNYDYEGMELDFTRDPVIVKPVATDEEREVIFNWIAQIRALTKEKEKRVGRPFYLGMKASFRTELLYDYGLDIDRIINAGLLDFLALSNTYQTSWDAPIDEHKRRWGGKVAVYGYIEGAVNWLTVRANKEANRPENQQIKNGRDMTYCGEMTRGNAAGKLVLGADGLIQYNCFVGFDKDSRAPSAEWALKNLTDLEHLRGKPKGYSLESAFFYPLGTVALELPWKLPEYIWPSSCRAFRLPMCREPNDGGLTLFVQLIFEKKEAEPFFGVSVNGRWPSAEFQTTDRLLYANGDYGTLLEEHVGYVYTFPVSMIREGWNEFTVFNLFSESADRAVNETNNFRLMSLEIGVMPSDYKVPREEREQEK